MTSLQIDSLLFPAQIYWKLQWIFNFICTFQLQIYLVPFIISTCYLIAAILWKNHFLGSFNSLSSISLSSLSIIKTVDLKCVTNKSNVFLLQGQLLLTSISFPVSEWDILSCFLVSCLLVFHWKLYFINTTVQWFWKSDSSPSQDFAVLLVVGCACSTSEFLNCFVNNVCFDMWDPRSVCSLGLISVTGLSAI